MWDDAGDATHCAGNPLLRCVLGGSAVFVNGAAPADWLHNLLYGALFGLFCYATFELTNMALLKHWEWAVVVPDIAWGVL